jgi:uncharacterized membrane protein YkvA (DUF1232 family)
MKTNHLPSITGRGPLSILHLLRHLPNTLRLFWRLFRDPRVGRLPKALLVGAVLYVVSPIDFLDDFLPLIGIVDDLALVLMAGRLFVQLCPRTVVEEHLGEVGA